MAKKLKKVLFCEYCEKRMLHYPSQKNIHTNICQPEKMHIFCSEECKEKWLFSVQSNKKKPSLFWCIGKYFDRHFFIQKVKEITGKDISLSRFSEDISHIARLELVKKGNRKILKVVRENA